MVIVCNAGCCGTEGDEKSHLLAASNVTWQKKVSFQLVKTFGFIFLLDYSCGLGCRRRAAGSLCLVQKPSTNLWWSLIKAFEVWSIPSGWGRPGLRRGLCGGVGIAVSLVQSSVCSLEDSWLRQGYSGKLIWINILNTDYLTCVKPSRGLGFQIVLLYCNRLQLNYILKRSKDHLLRIKAAQCRLTNSL